VPRAKNCNEKTSLFSTVLPKHDPTPQLLFVMPGGGASTVLPTAQPPAGRCSFCSPELAAFHPKVRAAAEVAMRARMH